MYYPYFRGRQSELLALRDVAPKLATKKRVVPIVEPVMAKTGALKSFLEGAKSQHPHIVITNPAVGELVGDLATIQSLLAPYLAIPGNDLRPGFHVGPSTTLADVDAFLAKYRIQPTAFVFSSPNPALIPVVVGRMSAAPVTPLAAFVDRKVSPSLIHACSAMDRVLVRDGFTAQEKNADFPPLDFFSDLHRTYKSAGFHGFGDFNIVGDQFKVGGGPAHAVAIHLSELNPAGEIDTNHFVSNRKTGAVDTPGKFMEALEKLMTHVSHASQSFAYSGAVADFGVHHANRHFPGLPSVKRMSIRHHIELLETIV